MSRYRLQLVVAILLVCLASPRVMHGQDVKGDKDGGEKGAIEKTDGTDAGSDNGNVGDDQAERDRKEAARKAEELRKKQEELKKKEELRRRQEELRRRQLEETKRKQEEQKKLVEQKKIEESKKAEAEKKDTDPNALGGLLLIDNDDVRSARVPGITIKPAKTEVEIDQSETDTKDKKDDKGGLLGFARDRAVTIAKWSLVALAFLIFVIYRARSRRRGKRVVRTIHKK